MNDAQVIDPAPQKVERAPKSKRTLIIASTIVGALVVAGGATTAMMVKNAAMVSEYDAAAQQINSHNQAVLDAEAYEPQAAYLFVEAWTNAEKEHLARLSTVASAPESLISAKLTGPVKKAQEDLAQQFKSKTDAPDDVAKELHETVAELLKDEKHSFKVETAVEIEDSASGAKVTPEMLEGRVADEARLATDAKQAQSKVDAYEARLDALDKRVLADGALLDAAAADGLKHQQSWADALSKATEEAKTDFTKKVKALQGAVDAYNAEPSEQTAKKKTEEKEKSSVADRLTFVHAQEETAPSVQASVDLAVSLSAFVKSGLALQQSHDGAVAAEAAAAEAAAAEAAAIAAGAGGYVDPGTGGWVDTGWNGGGGGWVDPGWSNGGGGGYVPPAGGGGTAPPAGGGGGGYDPGYVPGGGGCLPPPPGWYPTGGSGNGCPTYSPPGGGGEDEW